MTGPPWYEKPGKAAAAGRGPVGSTTVCRSRVAGLCSTGLTPPMAWRTSPGLAFWVATVGDILFPFCGLLEGTSRLRGRGPGKRTARVLSTVLHNKTHDDKTFTAARIRMLDSPAEVSARGPLFGLSRYEYACWRTGFLSVRCLAFTGSHHANREY